MSSAKAPADQTKASVLSGVKVVVVEDEAMLSLVLCDIVEDLGGVVAGTAARLPKALELVAAVEFDIAILDVNLNGERVDTVADAVLARGKAVVFATGYGDTGVAPHLRDRPVVPKPYTNADIAGAVEAALRCTA